MAIEQRAVLRPHLVPVGVRRVLRGNWKLVVDGPHNYVFDLRTDLSERNDVAKWRQDVAQELDMLLTDWEASVDAEAAALTSTVEGSAR